MARAALIIIFLIAVTGSMVLGIADHDDFVELFQQTDAAKEWAFCKVTLGDPVHTPHPDNYYAVTCNR